VEGHAPRSFGHACDACVTWQYFLSCTAYMRCDPAHRVSRIPGEDFMLEEPHNVTTKETLYLAQKRSIHSRTSVSESSGSVGTRDISGGSHRPKPLSVTVQFATFGSPAIIISSSTDATLSPLTLLMFSARSMRWTLPYCITTAL
jgi:hypothetical protein